jgi:hypothetical protein
MKPWASGRVESRQRYKGVLIWHLLFLFFSPNLKCIGLLSYTDLSNIFIISYIILKAHSLIAPLISHQKKKMKLVGGSF